MVITVSRERYIHVRSNTDNRDEVSVRAGSTSAPMAWETMVVNCIYEVGIAG